MERIHPRAAVLMAIVLVMAAMTAPRALAQGMQRSERIYDTLKTRLSLTDDQSGKVKVILDEYRDGIMKARDESGEDRERMRMAFADLTRTMYEKVDTLLTAEQKVEFEKYKKDMQAQRRARMGRRPGGM